MQFEMQMQAKAQGSKESVEVEPLSPSPPVNTPTTRPVPPVEPNPQVGTFGAAFSAAAATLDAVCVLFGPTYVVAFRGSQECCGNDCVNCVWVQYWEAQQAYDKELKLFEAAAAAEGDSG